MNAPDFPHRRRCAAYRREWARRLIARGNPPGPLVPAYGSPAWCALPESDPARIAAVVLAAEAWAWTRDLLPELPAAVRGDGPDRQGAATPGEQAQPTPASEPPGDGSATPGSTPVRGDDPPRQGDHPPDGGSAQYDQGQHPDQTASGDGPPGHGFAGYDLRKHSGQVDPPGNGPATPGNQGGQP